MSKRHRCILDHAASSNSCPREDAKAGLMRWILLLQEFDIEIRDKKGAENLAADHLSRLENPHQDKLENKEINEAFPLETLGSIAHQVINRTDNQEKDEKQSQNDKTGLGMEKTVKDKAKSKPESQSSQKVNRKVNWSKSKSTQVNPEVKVKEI
ncbi:hypothetical protein Tco_1386844 [Tanacetum coccineum]